MPWLACIHSRVGNIIHATPLPAKIVMVTNGSRSMEMTVVCLLHDVLHGTVFQIGVMVT